MSITAEDIVFEIIVPACSILNACNLSAVTLLAATCAQETNMGSALVQDGLEFWKNGGVRKGGLGIFQMEEPTHDDIWKNFIAFKPSLRNQLKSYYPTIDASIMIYDMQYAAIMARLQYYRVSEAIPEASDLNGLANYYLDHYNTANGAATRDEFIANYNHYAATAVTTYATYKGTYP